ncbi:MAG: LysR family transcriptional regulator [Muribaculaceae bacterium]|nr:LysR family transcriptional regulator [Muribaculaceae bacterium]MDD6021006.1 LysR substrate-binding domain-containing protein [bacterium]MDD6026624.1 LysR substrate-binding domain-containing protein [bacterium]
MELRQLRYFVKTAETRNFSHAASCLNIAQSSLSQQIKHLEDELGTQLFIRDSHSLQLTEAGEVILPFALRTIQDAEACVDRINDLRKLLTGTLNIGVTHSFSPILTESVISFIKMYPKIKVNIVYKQMNELMELLSNRELDFVLAFKPIQTFPNVESHILFQNTLSAIVGKNHPLASKEKVSISELEKYDLALPSKGMQARNAFNNIVSDCDVFKIRIELNDVNTLLKLVRQTSLVTVLAEDSIYDFSDVKAVPIDVHDNQMSGCVHILKETYRKQSMQEFIRILTESIAVKRLQNNWI